MSDSEQEMALKHSLSLSSIKTLQELYKAGVLKAVKTQYSHKQTLLDRVSVWSVPPIRK